MSLSLAEASWVNIYLIPRGLSHQTKVRCKEGGCVGDSCGFALMWLQAQNKWRQKTLAVTIFPPDALP